MFTGWLENNYAAARPSKRFWRLDNEDSSPKYVRKSPFFAWSDSCKTLHVNYNEPIISPASDVQVGIYVSIWGLEWTLIPINVRHNESYWEYMWTWVILGPVRWWSKFLCTYFPTYDLVFNKTFIEKNNICCLICDKNENDSFHTIGKNKEKMKGRKYMNIYFSKIRSNFEVFCFWPIYLHPLYSLPSGKGY